MDSGLSGQNLSHDLGHCVAFLGNISFVTLRVFLRPSVQMGTGHLPNAGGNLVME